MFSLKKLCQMLAVIMVTLSTNLAHAQVLCVTYPIYYDGYGNYLFVTEIFASDPAGCNEYEGDALIWIAANQLSDSIPQPCGTGLCTMNLFNSDVADIIPAKGTKNPSPSQASSKFDRPIPNVPEDLFNFGKDPKNKPFPSVPPTTPNDSKTSATIPDPSAGIFAQTGDLIWVQSTKGLIPIRLYQVIVDYDLAGVPASAQPKSGPQRKMMVGLQVKSTTPPPENGIAPTLQSEIKYSGKVHYANPSTPKQVHAYHIVTQTPLQ